MKKDITQITWKKNVKRINFPFNVWNNEPWDCMRKVQQRYQLPRYTRMGYEVIISKDIKFPYTLIQVYIEK